LKDGGNPEAVASVLALRAEAMKVVHRFQNRKERNSYQKLQKVDKQPTKETHHLPQINSLIEESRPRSNSESRKGKVKLPPIEIRPRTPAEVEPLKENKEEKEDKGKEKEGEKHTEQGEDKAEG
jgi:hypothetical protein